MMLVLDANILVRAVPGSKVLLLLRKYDDHAEFFAPDTAFAEAREHVPSILKRRRVPVAPAIAALDLVARLVHTVEAQTYAGFEAIARRRMARRDEQDWPVLVRWAARFGPKTPTSSAVAWQPGQPAAWNCT